MLHSSFPSGFQWHWKAHLRWGRETLVFMLLRFTPTYDRGAAVEGLRRFMASQKISSYAFYELSAPHDVLVRAWLPSGRSVSRLRKGLSDAWPKEHPAPRAPIILETLQIMHHWPWQPTDLASIGEMHKPDGDLLRRGRPARELDALNGIQRAVSLAPSTLPPTSELIEPSTAFGNGNALRELVGEYKRHHLITEPAYDPGIRFLVLIEAAEARHDEEVRKRLARHLSVLLDEAQNDSQEARIWDRSLYSTDGEYPFLILGRVDESPGHFHSVGTGLVANINDRLAAAGARTHTSFFQRPGFLDFRDELPVRLRPRPTAPDATELLGRHESATLEVKGSAFAELADYFAGRAPKPHVSTDLDNKTLAGLIRAVVSMLNSAEDGHIVLGALEPKRFPSDGPIGRLPEVGNFKVCGIELDLEGRDWDRYARRLEQELVKRIRPDPLRWVRLSPSAVAGGKIVCVISVSVPDEWYLGILLNKDGGEAEEQFIVRGGGSGASTRRLKDLGKIDEHKRRTRRAPRHPDGDDA